MKKLSSILGAICFAVVAVAGGVAHGEDYPNKTVRIVVPFKAGGLADLVARIAAQYLQEDLKQPFVVLNVPGANGIQGMGTVLQSAPDGYTILSASAAQWAIPGALTPELVNFDALKDFQPIGLYTQTSGIFIAVNESLGVKTIQELVALAKKKPGELSYASPGVGSIHHLLMESFKTALGLDITHIPYTNSYTPDLLNGQVSMAVTALPNVQGYVDEGKIRLLAVGNQARSQLKPDVPTIGETVIPGFNHSGVVGLLARAGTPQNIIDTLAKSLAKFATRPDVKERYFSVGAEPVADNSPAYLAKTLQDDHDKYTAIIKQLRETGGLTTVN